jgi:site-specific DNA-methyltransferase (adenine-specific)
LNTVIHDDCMTIMRQLPDKCIDLSIVDPPYGIGETWKKNRKGQRNFRGKYTNDSIPGENYFNELNRISKNYIIWGANYFNFGWPTKNVIIWDKILTWEKSRKGEAEMAITNLTHRPISIYKHQWSGACRGPDNGKLKTIHPHQKPVSLYRWCLKNYAEPGWLIFDSHAGSGSSIIACLEDGFDYIACEIDMEYFNGIINRIETWKDQGKLFKGAIC